MHIQRTERVPADSNIAQSNPEKFAQLLSEKLQCFKDEQDKLDRITASLHRIDVSPSFQYDTVRMLFLWVSALLWIQLFVMVTCLALYVVEGIVSMFLLPIWPFVYTHLVCEHGNCKAAELHQLYLACICLCFYHFVT